MPAGRAATTGTCLVIGEGAIPDSALGTGYTGAPARTAALTGTADGARTVTCPDPSAGTTTGEGVIAPAGTRGGTLGSGTAESPAPTSLRAAETLRRHAGAGRAAATRATREQGCAERRFIHGGAHTRNQIVGRL